MILLSHFLFRYPQMPSTKTIVVTSAISLIAVAVAWRVEALRKIVYGS